MQQVRFVGLQSDAYGPLRVRRRRDFQVGNGDAYFECSNDQLLAPLVVKDASLTSLKNAYMRAHRVWGGSPEDPTPMHVSPMHPESFDPELAPYLNPWLMVSASGIHVAVECETHELLDRASVPQLLRPLLKRRHAHVAEVERIDSSLGYAVKVQVEVDTRGRTVGQALAIGDEVEQLLKAAYSSGPLRPETVAELLRTGHHDVLIDQPREPLAGGQKRALPAHRLRPVSARH